MKSLILALVLGALALDGSYASSSEGPRGPSAPRKRPIAVKGLDGGRIRLTRASQRLVLDLGREISGCTGRLYDPTTKEEMAGGVAFEVVDETEKVPYAYVVLLALANPNCNVQGQCGAGGDDATLIWLKLTRDLTLAGQQVFVIEDCRAGRSARIEKHKDPGVEVPDVYIEIKARDLPWAGDVLQIEYEEQDGVVRRLTYDRRNPDAGLRRPPVAAGGGNP